MSQNHLVLLYDEALQTLATPQPCVIVAVDRNGRNLDVQRASRIGPSEEGAKISTPSVSYTLTVRDPLLNFGVASFGELNGKESGQINVVMRRPPRPSFVATPVVRTPNDIESHIAGQSGWTEENRDAVRTLVVSLQILGRYPHNDELAEAADQVAELLRRLGIDPTFLYRPQETPLGI